MHINDTLLQLFLAPWVGICLTYAWLFDIINPKLKNGNNQAVRLPKEFEFEGVTEVEITRDGESLILTPKRKSWTSFSEVEKADDDFLVERPDIMEEGRVQL